jgi:SAM-dependent methyltransferase
LAKTSDQKSTPSTGVSAVRPEASESEVPLFIEEALGTEDTGLEDLRNLSDEIGGDFDAADDEDLLSTLEMPVFRLPEALGARSNNPKATPAVQVPLSGIVKKRSAAAGREITDAEARGMMPFAVTKPPIGYELDWRKSLPAGEARRISQGRAQKAPGPPPAIKSSKVLPAVTAETMIEADVQSVTSGNLDAQLKTQKVAAISSQPPPTPARALGSSLTAREQPKAAKAEAANPPAVPTNEINNIVQELLDEEKPKSSLARKQAVTTTPAERAWFEQIFTDEYFRTLPMSFHKQTRREAQFILNSLNVGDGGRILDLCCGFGRHTIEMAKRNYKMVGLDLSLSLLQKALNEAQRRKLSIKFIHGDVRELNFNGIFDAAFCYHTSFGYFDDKTNFKVLCGVFQALKPGGRFLLEVINRDFIVQQLPNRKWWEGSECLFLEEVSFNYKTSVLHNKRTFIYDDNRPPWEQYIYIRLYSLHELQSLLQLAGFKILKVSGSINSKDAFFGADSPQLLVLAEKNRT